MKKNILINFSVAEKNSNVKFQIKIQWNYVDTTKFKRDFRDEKTNISGKI